MEWKNPLLPLLMLHPQHIHPCMCSFTYIIDQQTSSHFLF
jgi:hypothetical protein